MQPTPNWRSWQFAIFTQPDVAAHFIMGRERELLAWYFWCWRVFQVLRGRRLPMPLLGLGGEREAADFVRQALEALGERVTGGVVPDAGHWIAEERPEALAEAIIGFLREP